MFSSSLVISAAARDAHDTVIDRSIQCGCQLGGLGIEAANDFRNIAPRHRLIARILALGRKCNVDFLSVRDTSSRSLQTMSVPLFKDRDHYLFGRCRDRLCPPELPVDPRADAAQ